MNEAIAKTAGPRPDGRNAIRRRNRNSLLEAAEAIFRTRAYGDVSMRDIAAQAQVGLGTFYNHFKSKDDLFTALIESRAHTDIASQRVYRNEASSIEEFFERHFQAFFGRVADDPVITELFTRNASFVRDTLSVPGIGQTQRDLEDDLSSLIQKYDLPSFDTKLVAAAMTGVGIELAMQVVEAPPAKREEAIRLATALFARGLHG